MSELIHVARGFLFGSGLILAAMAFKKLFDSSFC